MHAYVCVHVCVHACVLLCCWLGYRKGIRPVKTEWWGAGVVICLELGADLQTSWCHFHSLSLASVKSRFVLPFWYQLTRVVPEKGPLNGCMCMCVCKYITHTHTPRQITTPAPHRSVFLQAGCPSCRPTNSVKALKASKYINVCYIATFEWRQFEENLVFMFRWWPTTRFQMQLLHTICTWNTFILSYLLWAQLFQWSQMRWQFWK